MIFQKILEKKIGTYHKALYRDLYSNYIVPLRERFI